MASLKKRRGVWYARVRWYDDHQREVEKQITLKTDHITTAKMRLAEVNNVEDTIKLGLEYSFAWLSDSSGITKVRRFTLSNAIDEWISNREKGKIRKSTLLVNRTGLNYLTHCLGSNRQLGSINDKDIEHYVDYLLSKRHSDNTINIHLRTVKAMFRHYLKIRKLEAIPVIDQRKIPYTEPIYITDSEFQSIMDLDSLEVFYKKLFLLYRDTGMRLREPFIATLNGKWVDISIQSKNHAGRSIELSESLMQVYSELMTWCSSGSGSKLSDPGDHLSKKFKKAMQSIGIDDRKHFHSLRHTFAVRKLLMGTSIYELKLLMGHSSVVTTERYSNMNLKRVRQDFPTIAQSFAKSSEYINPGHDLRDTLINPNVFIEDRMSN
jgi:site-specific recombinase XerD